MNVKLIGIGAAGNKAAISLLEEGIIQRDDIILLNSTLKDIPEGYADISVQFSGNTLGCGKERSLAKDLTLEALQNGNLKVDSLFDPNSNPEDNMVIIVNSSEGGTGCGASTLLAKYFKQVLGVNVHLFVFTGFEEDARGMQNTVEYFQDLTDQYVVEAISNKKFLEMCNGNKFKAEKAANKEFYTRIDILLGNPLASSEQNIDDTDLYKLTTTNGFMTIEHGKLENVKNVDAFNKQVTRIIDNSKSLDASPSAKRIGVILNIEEKTKDYIDYSFEVIKDKFGIPYEIFPHIQTCIGEESISIIAAGIKMPTDEVKKVYEKYKLTSEKINKSRDNFFDITSEMKSNVEDNMFNMRKKKPTAGDKANFFSAEAAEPKEKTPMDKF